MISQTDERNRLNVKYKNVVESGKVVLIMNGSVTFPMCGFSDTVCRLLKKNNVPFNSIDILNDPDLCDFLREIHSPEIIPYLYISGNFVGGYNKIVSLFESGQFFDICKI